MLNKLKVGDEVYYQGELAKITKVYTFGWPSSIPAYLFDIELIESNNKRTCYLKDLSLIKNN